MLKEFSWPWKSIEGVGVVTRNYIFVPDDRDGRGWWKLAEVLREVVRLGGPAPSMTTVASLPLPSQSYKEALQHPRSLDLSHQLDSRATSGADSGAISARTQGREEGGRRLVGLQKEMALWVMADMQKQLGELQFNLSWMKRCIEEDRGLGVDSVLGYGLSNGVGDGPKGQPKNKEPMGVIRGGSVVGPSNGPRLFRLEGSNRPSGSVWRRCGVSQPPAAVGFVKVGKS